MEKIRLQKFIADAGLMSRRAAEEEIKNGRSALAKYFDNMMNIFSSETITDCMKEKYKEIEDFVLSKGKTMDDVNKHLVSRKDNKNNDKVITKKEQEILDYDWLDS